MQEQLFPDQHNHGGEAVSKWVSGFEGQPLSEEPLFSKRLQTSAKSLDGHSKVVPILRSQIK